MPIDPTELWDAPTRALLDARTRAVSSPATPLARGARPEALGLRLAGERYAIAAHAIRGVAALKRLTALPHGPPELAGLIALGGEIIPAFHLRVVLGLPLGALPEYGRIVLMGDGAEALALVVDAVENLGPIEPDELREAPEGVAASVRSLILGVDRRGIPLLDHEALLASPRLYVEIPVPREVAPRAAAPGPPLRKTPR